MIVPHVRDLVRRHPAMSFVVIAFAWSWTYWLALAANGVVVGTGQGWPTHLPGLLGPAVAAVVVTALTTGRAGLAELGARASLWRVGWTCYVIVGATALLAVLAWVWNAARGHGFPDVPSMVAYSGAPVAWAPVVAAYTLVVNGFGEELGWRGWLADRWLHRHSVIATAVRVWIVWGLWHLPLFLIVASFRTMGVLVIGWAIGLLAGSVVLTWLYRFSGRSVLVVALWHTVYNFTSATAATAGLAAAVSSTAVMVAAVVVAVTSRRTPTPRRARRE